MSYLIISFVLFFLSKDANSDGMLGCSCIPKYAFKWEQQENVVCKHDSTEQYGVTTREVSFGHFDSLSSQQGWWVSTRIFQIPREWGEFL